MSSSWQSLRVANLLEPGSLPSVSSVGAQNLGLS